MPNSCSALPLLLTSFSFFVKVADAAAPDEAPQEPPALKHAELWAVRPYTLRSVTLASLLANSLSTNGFSRLPLACTALGGGSPDIADSRGVRGAGLSEERGPGKERGYIGGEATRLWWRFLSGVMACLVFVEKSMLVVDETRRKRRPRYLEL